MKDERLYLIHIIERVQRIEQYTASGKDVFLADPMIQDAVIRNFEVIGEAAKRLSAATRKQMPTVPWRRIAGFRDVLIHQYQGIEASEVWKIREEWLVPLKSSVQHLLDDKPNGRV